MKNGERWKERLVQLWDDTCVATKFITIGLLIYCGSIALGQSLYQLLIYFFPV